MLFKWAKDIIKTKQVVGVEVTLLADDKITFDCTCLSIKKKLLVVDKKLIGAKSIEEIIAVFNTNIPFSLSLSGRGILHKKIANSTGDIQKNLAALLPNAKLEDFYFQQYAIENASIIFSLIRKSALHIILDGFKKAQLSVVGVTLGPFSVERLLPLLELQVNKLDVGGHHIEIKDNQIFNYNYDKAEYLPKTIRVDKELIEESLFVSYATALQTIVGVSSFELAIPELVVARSESIHKRIYGLLGPGLLIFFLVVLLINFLLFSHYNARYEKLTSSQVKYAESQMDLDTLIKRVNEREVFLKNAGWMKTSQVSYYADCLGETVPSSIILRELSINPWQEALSRAEKKFVFFSDKITLSGYCHEPTDLNPWIKNIRLMNWVSSVEIQNYTFDNREKKGVFLITVMIK